MWEKVKCAQKFSLNTGKKRTLLPVVDERVILEYDVKDVCYRDVYFM